jgi:hypothetical protein
MRRFNFKAFKLALDEQLRLPGYLVAHLQLLTGMAAGHSQLETSQRAHWHHEANGARDGASNQN